MPAWEFHRIFGSQVPLARRWEELADAWVAHLGAAMGRRNSWRLLCIFVNWFEKDPALATTADLQAWADWLHDDDYMPSTIHGYLSALSSFYTFALRQAPDLVSSNPVLPLLRPHQQQLIVRPLTRRELDALLAAVNRDYLMGQRDYALILFLIDTVWPARAARRLRWGDFHVSRQGVACRRTPPPALQPGGPRTLLTPLAWGTWAAIVDYLGAAERLAHIQPGDYIFTPLIDLLGRLAHDFGPNWQRKPLIERSLRYILTFYGRRVGLDIDRVSPRNIRYSAALLRWQAGASTEEIQRLLDHRRKAATTRFLKRVHS